MSPRAHLVLLSVSAAALLAASACSRVVKAGVAGSGVAAREVRAVDPFTAVTASGSLKLVLAAGAEQRVEVECDDNLLAHLSTQVRSGRLWIGLEDGSFRPQVPIVARVSVPSIHSLSTSGSILVEAAGLHGESLDASASGSCILHLAGELDRLEVHGSGSTRVEAFDLKARAVTLRLSGAGVANVHALERLATHAAGSATVRFRGDPVLETDISGVATIRSE